MMRVGKTYEQQEPVKQLLARIKRSRDTVMREIPKKRGNDLNNEANILQNARGGLEITRTGRKTFHKYRGSLSSAQRYLSSAKKIVISTEDNHDFQNRIVANLINPQSPTMTMQKTSMPLWSKSRRQTEHDVKAYKSDAKLSDVKLNLRIKTANSVDLREEAITPASIGLHTPPVNDLQTPAAQLSQSPQDAAQIDAKQYNKIIMIPMVQRARSQGRHKGRDMQQRRRYIRCTGSSPAQENRWVSMKGADVGLNLDKPMTPSIFDNPVESQSPMTRTFNETSMLYRGGKPDINQLIYTPTTGNFSSRNRLYNQARTKQLKQRYLEQEKLLKEADDSMVLSVERVISSANLTSDQTRMIDKLMRNDDKKREQFQKLVEEERMLSKERIFKQTQMTMEEVGISPKGSKYK